MRKKIVGMSVVIALLTILCAQSVIAQPPAIPITVYAWTDKAQYKPGETGTLKISVLNELEDPVSIYNITIIYPWFGYDAEKDEWVGNETIEGNPIATMDPTGAADDHYYTGVEFTIPTDGRAAQFFLAGEDIIIDIGTSEVIIEDIEVPLSISSVSLPVSITALDTWMTSLIAAVVVCTIILAIVILLTTRRAPKAIPPPPPPKAKAA